LKGLIPVAGNGSRLRPITDAKPKPLIEIAGRPILDYLLEKMKRSGITELILIVGYMKERIIDWVNEHYGDAFKIHYVLQEEQLGLGHAVYSARDHLDSEELLIALGDEIFSWDYSLMIRDVIDVNDIDGAIGYKEVDDYQHYGMIETNEDGLITGLIEKPESFQGRMAIAGVYYIKSGEVLRKSLAHIMKNNSGTGEYQLTDALSHMVDSGAKFPVFGVGEWHDCGRLDTMLKSNRSLLDNTGKIAEDVKIINSEITPPVYIGPGSTISESTIGPYVSIGAESVIDSCTLDNVIIESNTSLKLSRSTGAIFSSERSLRI
jgi:glucose-1-phosphate thymidylyltransferase